MLLAGTRFLDFAAGKAAPHWVAAARMISTRTAHAALAPAADPQPPIPDLAHTYREYKEELARARPRRNDSQPPHILGSRILESALRDRDPQVDAYEVLLTLCEHSLARSHHYAMVMKHFMARKQYTDALSLWIKFLESNLPYHDINMLCMAGAAYFHVAPGEPDYKTLLQILRLPEGDNFLMTAMQRYVNHAKNPHIEKSYNTIMRQYAIADPQAFQRDIESIKHLHILNSIFDLCKAILPVGDPSLDVSLISTFMQRYAELDRPDLSIRVYDTYSSVSEALRSQLLMAVASLPNRNQAFSRIMAVWNTLIKPSETLDESQKICFLLRAFIRAKQWKAFESLWDQDAKAVNLSKTVPGKEIYLEHHISRHAALNYASLIKIMKEANLDINNLKSDTLANQVLILFANDPAAPAELFDKLLARAMKSAPLTGHVAKILRQFYTRDMLTSSLLSTLPTSPFKNRFALIEIVRDLCGSAKSVDPVRSFYEEMKDSQLLSDSSIALFIDAEFSLNDGDPLHAENLMREYISQVSKDKLDKSLLFAPIEHLILNYSRLILTHRTMNFVTQIESYLRFGKEINLKIGSRAASRLWWNLIKVILKQEPSSLNEATKSSIQYILDNIRPQDSIITKDQIKALSNLGFKIAD